MQLYPWHPYYDRRKSFIQQYAQVLVHVFSLCKQIGWILGADDEKLRSLEAEYDQNWAKNDFYQWWSTYFGSFIYDQAPSLTYHRYKKISEEALKIIQEKAKEKIAEFSQKGASVGLKDILNLKAIDQQLHTEEALRALFNRMIDYFSQTVESLRNLYG